MNDTPISPAHALANEIMGKLAGTRLANVPWRITTPEGKAMLADLMAEAAPMLDDFTDVLVATAIAVALVGQFDHAFSLHRDIGSTIDRLNAGCPELITAVRERLQEAGLRFDTGAGIGPNPERRQPLRKKDVRGYAALLAREREKHAWVTSFPDRLKVVTEATP